LSAPSLWAFISAQISAQLASLLAKMKETEVAVWWYGVYYYGPTIVGAGSWLATSGWRTIPGVYHNIRQRW